MRLYVRLRAARATALTSHPHTWRCTTAEITKKRKAKEAAAAAAPPAIAAAPPPRVAPTIAPAPAPFVAPAVGRQPPYGVLPAYGVLPPHMEGPPLPHKILFVQACARRVLVHARYCTAWG